MATDESRSPRTEADRGAANIAQLIGDLGQAAVKAFADLRDAVELMDTKITPYGQRADGTTSAYIVADSTWHRVLAIARGSTSEAAEKALAELRAEKRAEAAAPRSGEGLDPALERFLDADTAVESFEENADANYSETGEQADVDRQEALWVERKAALEALHETAARLRENTNGE